MADGRMLSKRIVQSARFLMMPATARLLYYDLNIAADDDGVVEAYSIMRMTSASDDDLKLLVAKKFVIVLDENLVTYIVDWQLNNKLRADRKTDSIYKELLLKVLPDVKLLAPQERADKVKKKGGRPMDDQRTSTGQPTDGVSKDKLSKDKLSKDKVVVVYDSDNNLSDIYKTWNSNLHPISPMEAEKVKALYDEVGYNNLKRAIEKAVAANARNLNYIQSVARGLADGVDYDNKQKSKYQSSDEWLEEYLAEKEAEKNASN